MATVETVRGPVDTGALGTTLMHEHIFLLQPEMLQNYAHAWGDSYWNEEERVADAIAKLQRARGAGIETIVDPTVPGLGRYIPRIQRLNEAVDINIVVATGIYAFLELPNFLATRSDGVITGLFVREIREGIDDTGVKAAFLKCAVEHHGIVGDVPRILGCVAAAHGETGVPVMVHTNARSQTGRQALQFLTERGVDPAKIVIAHAGDSNDLDYLRELADAGAWLGQDRYGIEHFNPSADRLATTTALTAEGYADRIHLGHDSACFYDFMAHNPPFADERPDLLRIHNEFLPALRSAGVSDEQIDQMLLANPRVFFGATSRAGANAAGQAEALRPGRT
jgi:phosphotriesterase-related protein